MKTNRNSIWEFHNLTKNILTCETLTSYLCHIHKTCYLFIYFFTLLLLLLSFLFSLHCLTGLCSAAASGLIHADAAQKAICKTFNLNRLRKARGFSCICYSI